MPSAEEAALEKYVRAGSIAREAREFGVSHVAAGGSSLQLAEAIEKLILDRGAKCAFPVNIGVNEVAAHYTPSKDDDLKFRMGDIVKIDVGAHVDGYPGDTSATVEVGTRNHTSLIQAANEALKICVEMASPGTTVSSMGATVARTIRSVGFKPVQNLTGHSMERWNLHAGLSIPNIETRDSATLVEGMVVAIEPFSTTGSGKVVGKGRGSIFRIVRDRRAPPEVLSLFSSIQREFGQFPFAGRWCEKLDPDSDTLLQKMIRLGMIMSYPILVEVPGSFVAQAEHSIMVTSRGCKVLT
jgi:methionyl aminopeptidase